MYFFRYAYKNNEKPLGTDAFKIIFVRIVDISMHMPSLFNKVCVILQLLCAFLYEEHYNV